jgi:Flp pilus assembly protein TadG
MRDRFRSMFRRMRFLDLRNWAMLRRDSKGLAAIEFSFIASILSLAVLNVSDFTLYFYDRMEVNEAAQMGGQAAWNTCGLNSLPATTNCNGMSAAVTSAVQSTSLGTLVTLQNGSPSEGWYCVNSEGALQYMAAIANKPADCTTAGVSTNSPGDWIEVQTTYTWTPIFPGLSVAAALSHTITATGWMRLQ